MCSMHARAFRSPGIVCIQELSSLSDLRYLWVLTVEDGSPGLKMPHIHSRAGFEAEPLTGITHSCAAAAADVTQAKFLRPLSAGAHPRRSRQCRRGSQAAAVTAAFARTWDFVLFDSRLLPSCRFEWHPPLRSLLFPPCAVCHLTLVSPAVLFAYLRAPPCVWPCPEGEFGGKTKKQDLESFVLKLYLI